MPYRVRNILLILYCTSVATFTSLKVSGYSFRIGIINIILLIIVFSYPSIKFFLTPSAVWLKLAIVILLLGCVLLIKNTVLSLLAFGKEDKELVQEWNFPKSKVTLTKRQGWAGPVYYRYDLIRFKLFNTLAKSVAFGYMPDDGADSCVINFSEGEEYKKRFIFDKCKNSLYNNEMHGR